MKIHKNVKIENIKKRLDALHVGDVKSAYVPFDTLGKIIVGKISMSALCGNILVVSDVGLLIAIRYRLKGLELDTSNVTFLCHTEKLRDYVQGLGIKTWFAPYNELDAFFREGRVQLDNDEIYFLKEKNMKTFDVVCGNPPFQPPQEDKKGAGQGSANKIWHKFVEKAFELSKSYVCFVTPMGWRGGNLKNSVQKKASKFIFENDITWAESARSPIDYFPDIGRSIDIDAWCVHVGIENKLSRVFKEHCLLPRDKNAMSTLEKFFEKCLYNEDIFQMIGGIDRRRNNDLPHLTQGDFEHQYKMADTSSKVRKGLFTWSAIKHASHDLKKVIVFSSGAFAPMYDDGTMGLSNHASAYLVETKEQGECLVSFLKTPIIVYVSEQFTQPDPVGYPTVFFDRIPKQILDFEWDEKNWKESAKQVFGFTNEECEKIENDK